MAKTKRDPALQAIMDEIRAKSEEMHRELGITRLAGETERAYRGTMQGGQRRDDIEALARGEATGQAALDAVYSTEASKIDRANRERRAANIRNIAGIAGMGLGALIGSPGGIAGATAGASFGSAAGKVIGGLLGGGDEVQIDPSAANDVLMGLSTIANGTLEQQLERSWGYLQKRGIVGAQGEDMSSMFNRYSMFKMMNGDPAFAKLFGGTSYGQDTSTKMKELGLE